MSNSAISVAMATYNGERFLQEQLDSLARQTLLPSELIVCDDGSTDGTLDILRRFQARSPFPVRIQRNEARLSAGFNFLCALGRCTGDLVAFCDQDDIWKEQKLSVCAEIMRDPGVTLVSHSAVVFSSLPLLRPWKQPHHRRRSVWSSSRDLAVRGWETPGFSIVLRRAVLKKVQIPEYSAAFCPGCTHDLWACIAALLCGRVVLLPDELVLRRLHEENVTLRPPRTGLKRLAPDPRGLDRGVENWAGLTRFVRYAASFCDQSVRAGFCKYIHRIERYGRACGDRATLHRACGHGWTAFGTLFSMLAKGDYAPRNLGVKAFIRDVFLAVFWPARDQCTVDEASPKVGISTQGRITVNQEEGCHCFQWEDSSSGNHLPFQSGRRRR